MSSSSLDNTILTTLQSSYTPYTTEESSADNGFGSEEFLTLLVAQLENQNPLDPADTDQFTDQLAQFSQLEQLIKVNDTLEGMTTDSSSADSAVSAMDYVGMQVTGTADSMTVDSGSVTSGYYVLDEAADVTVAIYDQEGNLVNTLDEGQVSAGSYLIAWDGTDADGEAVADGTYSYRVMANSGNGYEQITSNLTGIVDSVVFQNGTPYLVVDGVLMDLSSVTSATASASSSSQTATSIMEYLGKTVSSNFPIVRVDEGSVAGQDLSFYLESPDDVTLTLYNASDEAVATITLSADETQAGDNTVAWDALSDTGYQAPDGLYYYTVETAGGGSATTPVSGEVTAIQTVNGVQYLTLGDSGRLVSVSNVTNIQS